MEETEGVLVTDDTGFIKQEKNHAGSKDNTAECLSGFRHICSRDFRSKTLFTLKLGHCLFIISISNKFYSIPFNYIGINDYFVFIPRLYKFNQISN